MIESENSDKLPDVLEKEDLVMRINGPSKNPQNRANNFHLHRASAFTNFKAELLSVVAKLSE